MDKSWMGINRANKSYVDEVAAFIDYAVYNSQKMGNIDPRVNKQHLLTPCPSTKCSNHIEHKVEEVKFHLFINKIDLSYTNWTRHGEKDEPSISSPKPVNATIKFVDDVNFALDILTDSPATVEMVNATKHNFDEDDLVKFQELLLDTKKPLYKGCPDFTKLSAIVKLLNLKGKYEAFDKFFTELLGLIKKMLPAENNVAKSLVGTLLHVLGKTKDGVNARLDLAELGVKPELFAMQKEDKTILPPAGYTLTNAEKDTFCEMLHNIRVPQGRNNRVFSDYHKSMETIGIPPDKHETDENKEGKPLSAGKSSEVYTKVFQKALLIELRESKRSPKKVYQKLGVSVEAIDLHVSKEVATTRQAFYYGVLQEIWVPDYHFRQIPLFKCGNRDTGYTLVDLNNLSHKDDPFILASQARQVFYVKDQIDKKNSIVFKTPPKNYKDTYDEVDEEFSTVIHQRNDNILPRVNQRDLGKDIVYLRKALKIDYDSLEPPKSLLKWYHYLSDEYKDNGRFWGSKSGCNESDVKPSWKDIEKAKACMLAKAQASETYSKAKVKACGLKVKVEAYGSKAKLQTSTKTLIVKSPVPITNCVLGLTNAKT
uniref:Transposase-associated domain-containing protein n=1 Tax=Tanacetum cinerariifolium TaxID=118510 RepID=A0A699H562_TANCI|nr:hypothetical protein [Tanacetum cinerariifolium]